MMQHGCKTAIMLAFLGFLICKVERKYNALLILYIHIMPVVVSITRHVFSYPFFFKVVQPLVEKMSIVDFNKFTLKK
jgi:hypothetical protein